MASLIENMAPEYTTDGAKAGNYYMHSKLLYLCKSDCSGLFDESNFEQVYLSDLLRGTANSNLGGLTYSKITYTTGSSNQEIYTINEDCDVLIIYGIDGNSLVGYINSDKFSEIVYGKQYAWGTWDKILVVKGVKSGFQVRFGYANMQFLVIKGKK